jgi:SAM-dependent methyltransferase
MTALTAEGLRGHYQELFQRHGDTALATQMSSEGQRFRFRKLFEIGDLAGASILDLGCGIGAMYPALRETLGNRPFRYEGIDVVPEMIAHARVKYPGVRFRCVDLLSETVADRYDYVLMSVVFNNAIVDATAFMERLLEAAFGLCRVGLGFNFLSTHVNFSEPTMAYHDPSRVLDFCIRRLSRKVTMAHHYERCDVSVFVYR